MGRRGVSVYQDIAYAIRRARNTRFRLGSYVVPVCIPEDSDIEFRQAFDRRHYTIYAKGAQALELVCGPAVAAKEHDDG